MKRMLPLLLVLLALVLPGLVLAEGEAPAITGQPEGTPIPTPVPTPAPTATPVPTPTPIPVLVDRINGTVHTDFAFAEEAPLLEVIFPQILNCDAAYLRVGDETLLVDCCTTGQAVRILDMCKQLGITHIDRVLNTHPHEDHIGGLRNLLKEITVDELWICFPEDYNNHMAAAVQIAQYHGVKIRHFKDGDILKLGDATIEVWKLDGSPSELNDCSAQLFITYGDRTLLMAADLLQSGQVRYVEWKGDALDADILKYPHHGLEKLAESYAEAVSPLFCVVPNNQRPTSGKQYILQKQLPAVWTVPGFVYLSTDGRTWVCDRIVSVKKY